jgi:hypothetical protein
LTHLRKKQILKTQEITFKVQGLKPGAFKLLMGQNLKPGYHLIQCDCLPLSRPLLQVQGLKPGAFKRYGSNWIQVVQPRTKSSGARHEKRDSTGAERNSIGRAAMVR